MALSGEYCIFLAFVIDLILGDPRWLPHPVRWMGKAIERCEPRFRKIPFPAVLSGGLFAASLIVSAWALSYVLLVVAHLIHPLLKPILEIVILYYCISIQSLRSSALKVYDALKRRRSEEAKLYLSHIVGRDTAVLSEKGIIRAAVETTAENLVDGVISPLFFSVIGGAPLAIAYKMINTLDSMVGYKTDRYRDFGKAAARIDDAANYVPARLSVPITALCAEIVSGNGKKSLTVGWKEGSNHLSPNSGYPEAAFAGALEVKLGGPNSYQGKIVAKPYIGTAFGEASIEQIRQSGDLMLLSSLLWVTLCGFVMTIWH